MDISDTIKFRDICYMLKRIKDNDNKDRKINIVQQYYDSFCKHREKFREEQKLPKELAEDGRSSFYCILRCLLPRDDYARPPYGLQIPTLGKIYIKILHLGSETREAEILEARSFNGFRGDYAERVYSVLKSRCTNKASNLRLKQIHNMLDTIANENRLNTEKVLVQLSEIASSEEQMWFVRLLLKSMHLGIGDRRIFAMLHPQAKAFFQVSPNLLKLCCCLADNKFNMVTTGSSTLTNVKVADLPVSIQPFEFTRPQLCEIFPGDIEALMANNVLYLETKMDGERFQLHYQNNCFKYFSRNGVDFTESFGSSYDGKNNLTSKLKNLMPIGLTSIILDGEMMVWNTYHNKYHEKSENTDVKHLQNAPNCQPCFVVYDILYWNDESLLQMPYIQRVHKLNNLIKEQQGVLCLMKNEKLTSVEDFKLKFQQALDRREEGVVLKQQTAAYRPGRRNGGGWYKVKADYIEGLTTEFDLLVMGAFFNRTRTFVESFLVGVLKYTSLQQFEVYSIGKVSNNIQQRVALNNTLKPHWHVCCEEPPPFWYHYKESVTEGRPDAWIEPKNSVILQIKATDLNPSGAFALTMSLHFPRIQAWRKDKIWHECLSLEEFNQIKQNSGTGPIKKIVKRAVSLDDLTGSRVKRKRMTAAEKRKMQLQRYITFDPSSVEKKSTLLQDFSVCILSASLKAGYSLEYLKTLVIQNGGTLVDNPLPNNPACIVVAGEQTYRVKILCKKQQYDIVSMDWFLRICEKQKFKLKPYDMLAMKPSLRERFSLFYDEWGDHYTEYVTLKELKRICGRMQDDSFSDLNDEQMLELENLIHGSLNRNWFRAKSAYFYTFDPVSIRAKLSYQWHGGNILDDRNINEDNSYAKLCYIFINPMEFHKTNFLTWLKERFKENLSELQIVNIQWVLESHKNRILLDIKEYTWHGF